MLATFEEKLNEWNSIVVSGRAGNFIRFANSMNAIWQQHIVPTLRISYEHNCSTLADVAANAQLSSTNSLAVSAVNKEASFVGILVGLGEMSSIAIVELKVDESRR